MTAPGLPAYVRDLLDALVHPERCAALAPLQWDRLIRSAHTARLLGVLAVRVGAALDFDPRAGNAPALDPVVRRALRAASVEAHFRLQKMRHLLETVAPTFAAAGVPCVLLKGAGYAMQGLPVADGRLPADVDVMVPRAAIDSLEAALIGAGWQYDDDLTPYDQHYYRAWGHELPPLRLAGQVMELDLHHAILPPLGRLKPDTQALFDAATPFPGTPYSVLAPADQVLLAAAHLFHDSDCTDRLRDLVDLDGLLRAFSAHDAGFWQMLVRRAELHQLGRPLWYTLTVARKWLETPVPPDVMQAVEAFRPVRGAGALVIALAEHVLAPVDPDGEPTWSRTRASQALLARTTWLRMPRHLVLRHGLHKTRQWFVERAAALRPQAETQTPA